MTEAHKTSLEITSMFKLVFGSEEGTRCLEHLRKTFVDREIAKPGADLLEIGMRQGEANVINKIIKEVQRD